jgi:hypothetical protein
VRLVSFVPFIFYDNGAIATLAICYILYKRDYTLSQEDISRQATKDRNRERGTEEEKRIKIIFFDII